MVSPFVDETIDSKESSDEATTSCKIQNDEVSSTKGLSSDDEISSYKLLSEDERLSEMATSSQSVDDSLSEASDDAEKEALLENYDIPDEDDISDKNILTNKVDIQQSESIEIISDEESSENEAEKEALAENYDIHEEAPNHSGVGEQENCQRTIEQSEATIGESLVYTLISVHIETFRVSNEPALSLSQIGCTTTLTGGGEKETFFQPIKPAKLEELLEKHKMEGDLLKALHMTDENGKFEFRAQFEIRKRKEKNKIYAVTEGEAVKKLWDYLGGFKNVVLATVDENTMEIILAKLMENRQDNNTVVGFTTWPKVLENCIKFAGKDIYEEEHDLEDFYSRHCGKVSGYINALDVAKFLGKSMKKLGADYAGRFKTMYPERRPFSRNDFIEEIVEDVRNIEPNSFANVEPNKPLTVEVFSSFRPAVSTTIGIQEMDMVELSSGSESEDSDIDIVEENLKPRNFKRKSSLLDKDLLAAKRKYPYDFPEYPSAKRPVFNFTGDPIVISSDEEDDEEITLDEELPSIATTKGFSSKLNVRKVQYTEELLKKNFSSIRVTKLQGNEGAWLEKPSSSEQGSKQSSEQLLADEFTVDEDKLEKDEEYSVDEEKLEKDLEHVRKTYDFDSSNVSLNFARA